MARNFKETMTPLTPTEAASTSALVDIVTNLGEATKHLTQGERSEINDAMRSVVQARYLGETLAEHVRVL